MDVNTLLLSLTTFLVMDIFFSYKKNLRLWICSKIYKAEIELKREKIVRSGRGGEFYDRYGFKENIVDHCIYLKISGSKIIFLVLYVDDILLASNDLDFAA